MTLPAPPPVPPLATGSRLLRLRTGWILGTAALVLLGAAAFSALQTPRYEATAEVVVLPEVTASAPTAQTPSMGTEKSLVLSDVVAAGAARRLGVPLPTLVEAATVTVPPQTETLQVTCSMPEPVLAARCAQGLGEAYVAYKDSQPIPTVPERARVITPSVVPPAPATPDLALNLLAGALVGLVLGVLVAIARDRLDDRVREPDDLERRGLRVLGVVPTRGAGAGDGSGPAERARAFGALAAKVRTAVEQASPGSSATPVVVVTATAEEDTLEAPAVATSLATALASAGERVVLVHADTASPTGAAPGPGLLDVLAGRVPLDAVVRRAVHPQLRDLPAGRRPPLRIGGRDWARVTAELAASADVVVVAADPMLVTANGLTAARGATAVVAVAVGRTTTRTEVDGFLRECREFGLPLVGTVLTTDAVRGARTDADADWGRWTDEGEPGPGRGAAPPAPAEAPAPRPAGGEVPAPRRPIPSGAAAAPRGEAGNGHRSPSA